MENTTTNTTTTNVPVSNSNSSKKRIYITIFIILGMLLLCACILIGLFLFIDFGNKNPVINPTQQPTIAVTSTPEPVIKGTITGDLSFPSEGIPALTVCAVDANTKVETCKNLAANTLAYDLQVNPGSYYVYAKDTSFRAYYTKCDSNPNIKCNDDIWYQSGFVCYNNAECKLAFLPMVVSVTAGKITTGINIMQGWYIPCSAIECPTTLDNQGIWQNYMN